MSPDQLWSYTAEDRNGAVVEGALSANDLPDALKSLERQGLSPINMEKERNQRSGFGGWRKSTQLTQKDLTQFCTRMADLLSAGVSALQSLHIISNQTKNERVQRFSERLENKLRKGQTLSHALQQDSSSPPNTMIALVAAGETLGDMGGAFSQLALSFEAQTTLRREIVGQLIYPAALFILLVLTIIFLSFFVLPQFESVFATASAPPPPETQFVLSVASFIRRFWLIGAAATVGFILPLYFFIKSNKPKWDQFVISAPVVGKLVRKMETARYSRSLGELLSGGLPLARAMPIAQSAVSNTSMSEALDHIQVQVKNGAPLSVAINATPCLASDIFAFFELGEETGDSGRMVTKGASYIEQEVSNALKRFAVLSGPIMTAIMGLMTAGVIAAVMTGVLSLNDTVY